MSSSVPGKEWHAKILRAWQLEILRFALTLDNADRLAVMAIASEIDRLGPQDETKLDFDFFRRTSAGLCAAILQPNELNTATLRQYLAWIDDDRLKRSFAAAMQTEQPNTSPASKPVKRDNGLWRGLSPRSSHAL